MSVPPSSSLQTAHVPLLLVEDKIGNISETALASHDGECAKVKMNYRQSTSKAIPRCTPHGQHASQRQRSLAGQPGSFFQHLSTSFLLFFSDKTSSPEATVSRQMGQVISGLNTKPWTTWILLSSACEQFFKELWWRIGERLMWGPRTLAIGQRTMC